jgi:hypothetical protein
MRSVVVFAAALVRSVQWPVVEWNRTLRKRKFALLRRVLTRKP